VPRVTSFPYFCPPNRTLARRPYVRGVPR
jgi:hypothetical protein